MEITLNGEINPPPLAFFVFGFIVFLLGCIWPVFMVDDFQNELEASSWPTTDATVDVKRGLITRSEGMELAKQYDSQRPHALDFYLDITGLNEIEIENKLIKSRDLSDFAKKLNKD